MENLFIEGTHKTKFRLLLKIVRLKSDVKKNWKVKYFKNQNILRVRIQTIKFKTSQTLNDLEWRFQNI